MKKLRLSRLLFFLALAILLAFSSFFFVFRNSSIISAITSPISAIVSRVDSIISAPFQFISSVSEDVKDLLNTYSENKILKEQLAELENQSELVTSLTEENEALSAEIASSSSISSQISVIGKVIVRSPISWYESLTVDLGQDNGVNKNMLVLSNGGLIGQVSRVDSQSSAVTLLTNSSSFSIPVKITTLSGDVYGLLESYDSDTRCFVISNLNSSLTVEEGDTVVTSGLDGETIANVSVGVVSSVEAASDSLNSVIYVTPTADYSNISYVTIVGD